MHEMLSRLHGGQCASGTTIERFRLNEVVSQVAFAGRRGWVYRRIVALAGVGPGDAVLDVNPARRPLPLHPGAARMRRAAGSVGPLEELAATAGYRIDSTGTLPLLRYVTAIRPVT